MEKTSVTSVFYSLVAALTVFSAKAQPSPPAPTHRWLGSFGNSQSFYVIDSAGRAHVWGENSHGQLGLGFRSVPIRHPVTLDPPAGLKFAQLASGPSHAIAVTTNGKLFVWGRNNAYQIGLPLKDDYSSPTPQPHTNSFTGVAANDSHAMMIADTGAVWQFHHFGFDWLNAGPGVEIKAGSGGSSGEEFANGRLQFTGLEFALPNFAERFPVGVTNWIDFSPSSDHRLAISGDGRLFGEGNSDRGQLPIPPTNGLFKLTEMPAVPGVSGWKHVVGGENVNLAEDNDSRIWWWGMGFDQQNENPSAPKLVSFPKGATNWLDIAVTSTFAMALSDQGELFAWGLATPETWSDPNATYAPTPELVRGLPNLLDPAAAIVLPFNTDTSSFPLQVIASPNVPIRIETSNDLHTWTPYKTVTITKGLVELRISPNSTNLFFRLAPL